MFKMGDKFYDDRNGRYLTVDGVGCDPKCYECIVEEAAEDGDLIVTGRVLMMQGELAKMERR